MKTIKFLFILLLIAANINAQNLLDIYKTGKVKLVADKEFGSMNNWDEVFGMYQGITDNSWIGNGLSLKLLPEGSFLVNHVKQKSFSKFSWNGEFVKEMNITSENGRILKTPCIAGVLNDEILFTRVTDYGKMFCADLDGNYIKTLDVDYAAKSIIPLPNKKFAIVGWAIWETKFRDFVAILDYETNEEEIIWDYFTDRNLDDLIIITNPDGDKANMLFSTIPAPPDNSGNTRMVLNPLVALTKANELILCIPQTGEMIFYDLNGKKLHASKVNWKNEVKSAEEMKEIYEKNLELVKDMELVTSLAGSQGEKYEINEEQAKWYQEQLVEKFMELKEKYTKPNELPYFSTIIQDSDNNILFFEYPKEEGMNQFNVYTFNGEGKFVCKSSFVCDEYDLIINPDRLVFKDGYLYGVQVLKESSGIPLRLVKFSLEPAG